MMSMKAARAARAKADAFSPSDAAVRKMLAAAEQRAAAKGFVAKTESALESLTRKWLRFLATHGKAYGWEECDCEKTLMNRQRRCISNEALWRADLDIEYMPMVGR